MHQKTKSSLLHTVGLALGCLLILVLLCGLLLYFLKDRSADRDPEGNAVEVQSGSVTELVSFPGVITRSEQLVYSKNGGIVEYFYPEGEHLSSGTTVCCLRNDHYGQLLREKLAEVYRRLSSEVEGSASASLYGRFNDTFRSFFADYLEAQALSRESDLYAVQEQAIDLLNTRSGIFAIEQNAQIHLLLEEQGVYRQEMDAASMSYTLPKAGKILYSYDGYEGWLAEQVDPDFIDRYRTAYQALALNLESVAEGAVLYRFISEEEWSITAYIAQDTCRELTAGNSYHLKLDDKDERVTLVSRDIMEDGTVRLIFRLDHSVLDYADRRIVTVSYENSGPIGVKVPLECIYSENYYVIPQSYLYRSTGHEGIMVRENGKESFYSVQTIPVPSADSEETRYCFALPAGLSEGTVILEQGTSAVMTLNEKIELNYCLVQENTEIRHQVIRILSQNENYAVVEGLEDGSAVHIR